MKMLMTYSQYLAFSKIIERKNVSKPIRIHKRFMSFERIELNRVVLVALIESNRINHLLIKRMFIKTNVPAPLSKNVIRIRRRLGITLKLSDVKIEEVKIIMGIVK